MRICPHIHCDSHGYADSYSHVHGIRSRYLDPHTRSNLDARPNVDSHPDAHSSPYSDSDRHLDAVPGTDPHLGDNGYVYTTADSDPSPNAYGAGAQDRGCGVGVLQRP